MKTLASFFLILATWSLGQSADFSAIKSDSSQYLGTLYCQVNSAQLVYSKNGNGPNHDYRCLAVNDLGEVKWEAASRLDIVNPNYFWQAKAIIQPTGTVSVFRLESKVKGQFLNKSLSGLTKDINSAATLISYFTYFGGTLPTGLTPGENFIFRPNDLAVDDYMYVFGLVDDISNPLATPERCIGFADDTEINIGNPIKYIKVPTGARHSNPGFIWNEQVEEIRTALYNESTFFELGNQPTDQTYLDGDVLNPFINHQANACRFIISRNIYGDLN